MKATPIETLTKVITDMQTHLTLVLDTLDTTQQRLTMFGKSLSDNQAQPSTTRRDLVAARSELSLLSSVVPTLETKAAKIEASFSHVDNRLALVEESAAATTASLADDDRQASVMRVSAAPVQDVQGKSSGRDTVRGSKEKRLSAADSSPLGPQDRSSGIPPRQTPQPQESSFRMLETLSITKKPLDPSHHRPAEEATGDDLATKKRSSPAPIDTPSARGSATTVRDQVINPDCQIPSVEIRLDDLERSFGGTKKGISVVRTRLPTVESKVEIPEKSVGQIEAELSGVESSRATAGGQSASPALRIVSMEDSLREIRVGAQQDPRRPGGSRNHSPLLFPSEPSGGRNSTPSPSSEAAFFDRQDSDSDVGD